MRHSRKTLAAILSPVAFALLLTACGGGGGGSGNPAASNDPAPPAPAPDPIPPELEPTPPVAMPEPEPTSGQRWPSYLIMDAARLASVLGGSALDWGNDQALSELRTRLTKREIPLALVGGHSREGLPVTNRAARFGPAGSDERLEAGRRGEEREALVYLRYARNTGELVPDSAGSTAMVSGGTFNTGASGYSDWYRIELDPSALVWDEEALISDEHGITYVQGRRAWDMSQVAHDPLGEFNGNNASLLGGLLDYADFWIVEEFDDLDHDQEFHGPFHSAFYRVLNPIENFVFNEHNAEWYAPNRPIEATWRGSLIGIGHNKAYENLYRQPLAGDVQITTTIAQRRGDFATPDEFHVEYDVEFSGIKKVNTGEAVTLSTQNWRRERLTSNFTHEWHELGVLPPAGSQSSWNAGTSAPGVRMHFGGPAYTTVAGSFITSEAIGAFGAKKQ